MTGSDATGASGLDITYAGGSASLNDARGAVAGLVAAVGAGSETVERARLLVSELTSNAVQAAPDEPYQLTASVDQDVLVVEVRNRGDVEDLPAEGRWKLEDVLAARGRGLSIVEALADRVTVSAIDGGWLAVTATLHL